MELTTTYSFLDLYSDVADYRGKTRTPTGTDLIAAKRLVNDAYRSFLIAHDWNFLKKIAVLVTENTKWQYELPDDFRELTIPFKYSASNALPNLSQVSVDKLLNLRTGISDTSGQPYCFALTPADYTVESGTRWLVLLHYPSNGIYELIYQYRIGVNELVNDTDIVIGGAEHAPTIRAFCLAEVEQWDGESIGVWSKKVYDPEIGLLRKSIMVDSKKASRSVGIMGGTEREFKRFYDVLYNGVDIDDWNP